MTEPAPALCAALPLPAPSGGLSAPDWVHLLPAGVIQTMDGRGPYHVADADALIRTSMQGGVRLPLDENHSTDLAAPKGGPSPARGWIVALQARQDGIWGRVEWTNEGRQIVAGRAYRHISPVIHHMGNGKVIRVARASLVNAPNLRGLVALHQQEIPMDLKAQLAELLGLAAPAEDAAIILAVRELLTSKNSAGKPNPAEYVPIGDFLHVTRELRRVNQGVEHQVALNHVEEQIRAGLLFPYLKEWGVELCTMNKPAFDDLVAKMGGTVRRIVEPSPARHVPPSFGQRGSDLTDTDAHVASILGLSTEDFSKAGRK